ncbi:MAG: hypothetical protein SP1CHLAM54_09960 [Chlamydiia bacterium]|nr:hypothetical protein [Chlamydiia bacterium]MCH9615902.1 hypothetical protein [Chlamydiia bacterium]MCH9628695.1 hypothetical protein [Chlamydiia bacterium]
MSSGINGISGAGGASPIDPTERTLGTQPTSPPSAKVQMSIAAAQTLVQVAFALNGQNKAGRGLNWLPQSGSNLMINMFFQALDNASKALAASAGDPSEGPHLKALYKAIGNYNISIPPSLAVINNMGSKFANFSNTIIQDGWSLLQGVNVGGEQYGVFKYAGDNPTLVADPKGGYLATFPGFPDYPDDPSGDPPTNGYNLDLLDPTNPDINNELNRVKGTTGKRYYPPGGGAGLWDATSGTSPYVVWSSAFSHAFDTLERTCVTGGKMDLNNTTDAGQDALEQISTIVMNLQQVFTSIGGGTITPTKPLFQGAGFLNLLLHTPMGTKSGDPGLSLYNMCDNVDGHGNAKKWTAYLATGINSLYNTSGITENGENDDSKTNVMEMMLLVSSPWTDPGTGRQGGLDGQEMEDLPPLYSDILSKAAGTKVDDPQYIINWNVPNVC